MTDEIQQTDTSQRSWNDMLAQCFGTKRDRRNQYILVAWMFTWVLSYVAAKAVHKADPEMSMLVQWLAGVVPNVLAAVALLAFLRFLRMADELVRRIEMEALAIGFGIGVMVGLGYPLFEFAGAPPLELKHLVSVMLFGWVAGQFIAMRRYR